MLSREMGRERRFMISLKSPSEARARTVARTCGMRGARAPNFREYTSRHCAHIENKL